MLEERGLFGPQRPGELAPQLPFLERPSPEFASEGGRC